MHNDLFTIGPITIHGYGLMIGLGVVAALLTGTYRAKKHKMNDDLVVDIAIWGLIGGFLCAKLLFIITELPFIIQNPSFIWESFGYGFVVYGGIIGGVLAAWLCCRVKKERFLPYFDLLIPSVALAQGFGRIGCFLAGCCYGQPTTLWWGITFQNSTQAPNNISLIPTQLLSSAGDILLCILLILLYKRKKFDGQIGALYMILYSLGRFGIEFLRGDPRGTVGLLSTSQFIAIFMALGGVALYLFFAWRHKHLPPQTEEAGSSLDVPNEDDSTTSENTP